MSFDPVTASPAFDPMSAMPDSVTNQPAIQDIKSSQGQIPNMPQGPSPVDYINSLGSGIGQGIGKSINAVEGLGTDIAQGIGVISPQTKQSLDTSTQQFTSPNSITQDAAQKAPIVHAIGQGIGVLGSAGAATAGMTALSTGVLGAEAASVIANGIIGMTSAGDGLVNRTVGFGGGAVGTAILNKAASGVSALANASQVQQVIKSTSAYFTSKVKGTPLDVVQTGISNLWNTSKATSDQLFNSFRTGPGDSSKEAYLLQGKVLDTIDKFSGKIDNAPMSVFQNMKNKLKNASSIADLHDIRIQLNKAYDTFNPAIVGPPVTAAYKSLRTDLEDTMQLAAQKGGVLKEYLHANENYKTVIEPLLQINADKVSNAIQAINKAKQTGQSIPMDAAVTVKGVIANYIKPNQPDTANSLMSILDPVTQNAIRSHVISSTIDKSLIPDISGNVGPLKLEQELSKLKGTYSAVFNTPESRMMVDGMRTVIKAATPALKILPTSGSIKDVVLHLGELGALMSAGVMIGGAPTALGIGAAAYGIKSLLNTSVGQTFLKAIGSSSSGTQLLHQMINNGTSIGIGSVIDNYMKQVKQPPGDPELNPDIIQGASNGN